MRSRRGRRSGDVRARPPRAWVLNLDSEDELARGAEYRLPSREKRAEHARRCRGAGFLGPDDVVLDADVHAPDEPRTRGMLGAAFMPTPHALGRLAVAGCVVPPAPSLEVLRRANDRALHVPRLPGAVHVHTRQDALDALARDAPHGTWLCKRALGAAGRGHRRVRARAVQDVDVAWIDAALRTTGGIEITPWLERVADFAMHGTLEGGEARLHAPTRQDVDANGTWRASRPAEPGALSATELAALSEAATEIASALAALGYFGPFGIDAFRYRQQDGTLAFCACCDVNARFTMGMS